MGTAIVALALLSVVALIIRKMIKEYRFRNLDYIISYPENYKEGDRYPIVFHTPGAGARGRDLSLIEKNIGLIDRQNEGNEYLNKCLIVIPQCYAQN